MAHIGVPAAVCWIRRLRIRVVRLLTCGLVAAAVWLALVHYFHMAGEWVIGGIEAKVIAYGFVLLGLTAFPVPVRQRG